MSNEEEEKKKAAEVSHAVRVPAPVSRSLHASLSRGSSMKIKRPSYLGKKGGSSNALMFEANGQVFAADGEGTGSKRQPSRRTSFKSQASSFIERAESRQSFLTSDLAAGLTSRAVPENEVQDDGGGGLGNLIEPGWSTIATAAADSNRNLEDGEAGLKTSQSTPGLMALPGASGSRPPLLDRSIRVPASPLSKSEGGSNATDGTFSMPGVGGKGKSIGEGGSRASTDGMRSSLGSSTSMRLDGKRFGFARRSSSQATAEHLVSAHRDRARSSRVIEQHREREIFYSAHNPKDSDRTPERNETASFAAGSAQPGSFADAQAGKNRFFALQKRTHRQFTTTDPINFYDVVETESEPQASTTDISDRLAGKITESHMFQRFILLCICTNSVLSVLMTIKYYELNFGRLIDQVDGIFLTIFLVEMALKIKFQKSTFWYDNWNLFDFTLILASFSSTLIRDLGTRQTLGGQELRFLRVLRAFRTLRILGALRNLQIVVNTFLKSLVELTNIIAMILLLIFMFSILGLQLFQLLVPQHFGSLPLSFQTLFVLITQEGWVKIWSDIEEASKKQEVMPIMDFINHAYFVLFIVIGAWVFINIISGVTVTNWQLYVQEMKLLEKAKFHEIESTSLRSSQFNQDARPVSEANVDAETWSKQVPLSSASSVGKLSVQKLENYLLVLSALEKNAREYQLIKRALYKHLDVVQRTNMLMDVPMLEDGAGADELEDDEEEEFLDGDVLSMLQTAQNPIMDKHRGNSLLNSLMEKV